MPAQLASNKPKRNMARGASPRWPDPNTNPFRSHIAHSDAPSSTPARSQRQRAARQFARVVNADECRPSLTVMCRVKHAVGSSPTILCRDRSKQLELHAQGWTSGTCCTRISHRRNRFSRCSNDALNAEMEWGQAGVNGRAMGALVALSQLHAAFLLGVLCVDVQLRA